MRKMKRWGAVFCAALLLFTAQDGVNAYANNAKHQTVIGNQQNVVNEVELQGDSTDGVTPFVEQKNITMYQGTIFNIRWLNKSDAASVTYDVEDEEMLTVSEKGQIFSNTKEGTTKIKAVLMQGGETYKEEIVVTVEGISHSGLSVDETKVNMDKGDIYQLAPQVITDEQDANTRCEDRIYYSVSGAAIVSVTQNGVIQALDYGQTVVVISLANGVQLTCDVIVEDGKVTIKSLSTKYLTNNQIVLAKGQTRNVVITIKPSKASNKTLKWSSINKKIVTVTQQGKVTGKHVGTTYIKVRTTDGSNIEKKIKVIVKKKKSGTYYKEAGMKIVNSKHQKYSYKEMVSDIKALEKKYGDIIKSESLGKSWDNRTIYQITLGNPNAKKTVFVQAAIHAREYMVSQLVMKQIEFYCANYYTGTYKGKCFSQLFDKVCFKIVPMSNPDGVTISQYGPQGIRNSALRNNIKAMCKRYARGRHSYYTIWKANARGVDLNRNFNPYWRLLASSQKAPSAFGYKGAGPVSEKEAKILVSVVNKKKPTAVISYHAMGRILYWNFGQTGNARKREISLLSVIRSQTGYMPVGGAYNKTHATGFGDWVAASKKLPTVTIEIGSVPCPLPNSQFSRVWKENRLVLAATAKLYY